MAAHRTRRLAVTTVIALLGAESTGKTTLARELAQRLADATGLRVACVPEHLRAWCDTHGRTPRRDEQAGIARTQDDAIDAAASTHDIVVADTTSVMTAIYSRLIFDDDTLEPPAVAFMRARVAITLLMALDLPWQADGFQRDGPQVQTPVTAMLRALLIDHGLTWSIVGGTGAARTEAALDAVAPLVRGLPANRRGLFTRLDERNAQASARTWRCERCDDPDCEHMLLRARGT
jgi:nicotinamide riboside kinase